MSINDLNEVKDPAAGASFLFVEDSVMQADAMAVGGNVGGETHAPNAGLAIQEFSQPSEVESISLRATESPLIDTQEDSPQPDVSRVAVPPPISVNKTPIKVLKTPHTPKKRRARYESDESDSSNEDFAMENKREESYSPGFQGGLSREERKFQALLRQIDMLENRETGKRKRIESSSGKQTPKRSGKRQVPISGSPEKNIRITAPNNTPVISSAGSSSMEQAFSLYKPEKIDLKNEIEKRKRIIELLEVASAPTSPVSTPPLSPKLVGKKKWAAQYSERKI